MDGWIHNNGTNVLENGDEKVFLLNTREKCIQNSLVILYYS